MVTTTTNNKRTTVAGTAAHAAAAGPGASLLTASDRQEAAVASPSKPLPYERMILNSNRMPLDDDDPQPMPTRLQEAGLSMDEWQSFWTSSIRPIVRDMEATNGHLFWASILVFCLFLVALHVLADQFDFDYDWGFWIGLVIYIMFAYSMQAVMGRTKAKQLDTLRQACHRADETIFRRLGYTLDVDYEWNYSAAVCGDFCCRGSGGAYVHAWPVLYIIPMVGQKDDSSSQVFAVDGAHGDILHQQKGYVRIQHCNDGNLWTPVSPLELEAALHTASVDVFGEHNDTHLAARLVWTTFASKLAANRQAYLYHHRVLLVLASIVWTWIVIVDPLLIAQWNIHLGDDLYSVYAMWLGFVIFLGLIWRKSDLQNQTYALVHRCALDLARLGQRQDDDHAGGNVSSSNWHVEQRRIAEVSDCCSSCCAGFGFLVLCRVHYIYLFPLTTATQALQYNPQQPGANAISTVAVAENLV